MLVKAKIILRGNRYYTMMIMYLPGKWNEKMEKSLASFHPIDNAESHWSNVIAPDSLFTTWAPADFIYSNGEDTSKSIQVPHYECYDSNRIHIYLMRIDTVGRYFWTKNESEFWEYEK